MCVWNVPMDLVDSAGEALARRSEVTHCYQRPSIPGMPGNLYAMIHAADTERLDALVDQLEDLAGTPTLHRINFHPTRCNSTALVFEFFSRAI